jgi:hypothetical protein
MSLKEKAAIANVDKGKVPTCNMLSIPVFADSLAMMTK